MPTDKISNCPDIVQEWDFEKNTVTPDQVTKGSDRIKIWWRCSLDHSWEATPNSRFQNNNHRGCPYCSGRLVLTGFNDLKTVRPILFSQWNYQKNKDDPNEVHNNSSKKFWWKCPQGHEIFASPRNRTSDGYCSNCKIATTSVSKMFPNLLKEWDYAKNLLSPEEISYSSAKKAWWTCGSGHSWEAAVYSRTASHSNQCPRCSVNNPTSAPENEIYSWLLENGITSNQNDRTLLKGKELDIYVPELSFAIEFNGLYWHNDHQNKDRFYHSKKWKECQKEGIQLLQIWEDDWVFKKDIVKNMILHKMGLSILPKIYARKTLIKTLTRKECDDFLVKNHIQGSASGSIKVGLLDKENNKLVAVCVCRQYKNGNIEIIRYATATIVVGGFSKILKDIENKFNPKYIFTFSDNSVSEGKLYSQNGFIKDKILPPDYSYVVAKRRNHKFNYRLKKFRNSENLLFEEGLSESQLASLNKIPRIWDAGKIKWKKKL